MYFVVILAWCSRTASGTIQKGSVVCWVDLSFIFRLLKSESSFKHLSFSFWGRGEKAVSYDYLPSPFNSYLIISKSLSNLHTSLSVYTSLVISTSLTHFRMTVGILYFGVILP